MPDDDEDYFEVVQNHRKARVHRAVMLIEALKKKSDTEPKLIRTFVRLVKTHPCIVDELELQNNNFQRLAVCVNFLSSTFPENNEDNNMHVYLSMWQLLEPYIEGMDVKYSSDLENELSSKVVLSLQSQAFPNSKARLFFAILAGDERRGMYKRYQEEFWVQKAEILQNNNSFTEGVLWHLSKLGSSKDYFFYQLLPKLNINEDVLAGMRRRNGIGSTFLIACYANLRSKSCQQEVVIDHFITAHAVNQRQVYVSMLQILQLLEPDICSLLLETLEWQLMIYNGRDQRFYWMLMEEVVTNARGQQLVDWLTNGVIYRLTKLVIGGGLNMNVFGLLTKAILNNTKRLKGAWQIARNSILQGIQQLKGNDIIRTRLADQLEEEIMRLP